MNKEKNKRYETEWTFSFEDLGQSISKFAESVGLTGDVEVKTGEFSEPLGEAKSARVRLDLPVCQAEIKAASNVDMLLDAELTYVGEVKLSATTNEVNGAQEKFVQLSQIYDKPAFWLRNVVGWFGSKGRLEWNIGLTPNIPLDLDIHSGVGQSNFDLHELNLKAVGIYGGTGEIRVILPESEQRYPAQINGGTGEFNVTIAGGASLDLKVRAGTGHFNLEIGDEADVSADIKGGVGQFSVRVPQNAAVRVEANMGLGGFDMPSRFVRLSGGGGGIGGSGVWQTPDFETAARKITIHFDGGVGELEVR